MDRIKGYLNQDSKLSDPDSIRQERANFTDLMESNHKRALEEQKNKKEGRSMLPDSATEIINTNGEYNKWLSENPNANVNEIRAKKGEYERRIKNVLETRIVRNEYMSYFMGFREFLFERIKNKEINTDDRKLMEDAMKSMADWRNKNEKTASIIEFSNEIENFKQKILGGLKDDKLRKFSQNLFKTLKDGDPDKIKEEGERRLAAANKLADSEFRVQDIADSTVEILSDWWYTLIITIVGFFSGSLVANSAIHRPVSYRILYFLWGAIPLFVIPVFIYYILQRVRYGPLRLYTMLPLVVSTFDGEMEQGFFMRMLRAPFVYFDDGYISIMATEYQKTLETFTQT